jgi:IS5 family transposase
MAAPRSAVEHPLLVFKRQFGQKVRYRGWFKNDQHSFSRFALVDLCLARHLIVPAR